MTGIPLPYNRQWGAGILSVMGVRWVQAWAREGAGCFAACPVLHLNAHTLSGSLYKRCDCIETWHAVIKLDVNPPAHPH